MGDKVKATEYFRSLIASYPKDPLSALALATLGEWAGGASTNQQKSARTENTIKTSLFLENYPNPFNPSTVVSFSVPEAGLVTLKIFDLLGREVATLVNEFTTVGTHVAIFNGSSLSSGMYVARLQMAGKTAAAKLLLAR
ncbi:MAG: T9SS type A sorting domain-containing protein [Ignavibacteriales bacterium]|nr:T9SS type A sorting domain-containing protein [Ignavibacteriales bacterium]